MFNNQGDENPNKNFDLISIGDATVDVFMTPVETETLCKRDSKECYIAFSYGQKIPVKNLEFTIGGNAANNAVGTRRLGVKSSIVLTIGSDTIGNLIKEKLTEEGVDTTYIIQQTASSSNYSSIINYAGERTIFTYHAPRSYEFPVQLPEVPWVYLTSMGESYRPFYNHFVDWLRTHVNVKLAFNPGSWQIRAGLEGIASVLQLTHILFVNREEAEKISNFGDSNGKERDLLMAVSKLGPKIVIVTDGEKGSLAFDGKRFLKIGILPVDAYERTGAGDSFGSGFLAAIVKGKSLEEALLWGTVNSASVIGYTGAQKGLLKEDELSVWIKRAQSSGVAPQEF
jgi:sugar/nucleoside kinase (ribokinase family)